MILAAGVCLHWIKTGTGSGGASGGQTESKLNLAGEQKKDGAGETIRVLLMTSGYESAFHSTVSLAADGGLCLRYGEQEEQWTEGVLTLLADDERLKQGRVQVQPLKEGAEIRVESIQRGRGIPSYEGILEVWSGEEGMVLVNALPMEQYLCRVVPSEMPSSYEREALKAQAVCARSYAVRQMADYAYPEYQAHVDDSVAYQVYNNSYPADTASQAVHETEGEVVRYQGTVVPTYYFSTSGGKTTDAEAWGSTKNDGNAYLQGIAVRGANGDYEKDLPWYHWTAELSKEQMKNLLETHTGENLGTLKRVRVTRRGAGDVALELTAEGTEGIVVVQNENKIRTVLGGYGYQICRNDGQYVDSQNLLPSAFITIQENADGYRIEGGGYGHGIGMSQNGANEMAKDGMTYQEILKTFYQKVEIS